MAFQNIIFPALRLTHGCTKQIIDPVFITGNGLREIRRKQTLFDRYLWTFPARNMLIDDVKALYKFYRQTNGGLDSFLFQDPSFPEFNNDLLLNKSGSTWFMALPYDSTTGGRHPVFNPQMGSLTFTRNGNPTSATFSISSDGYPIVTIPSSVPSDTIRVTGPVYLTARFDQTIQFTIAATQKSSLSTPNITEPTVMLVGDVNIVEVFEV